MSEPNSAQSDPTKTSIPVKPIDGAVHDHIEGFQVDVTGDEQVDKRLAEIEMTGENVAAGWKPAPHVPLSPEVRYLHVSRTIHQLITDRNRSVGIFLFVASLLIGSSSALLNAHPVIDPIIPLAAIQYWCLPVTFGTLAVIAGFISLLLIRARIGLIYEVAKMHTLLGLPLGRVERVNPLSIFYLMHLLVATLGGASAGLTWGMISGHLARSTGDPLSPILQGMGVALAYLILLELLYYLTILRATSDAKLRDAKV